MIHKKASTKEIFYLIRISSHGFTLMEIIIVVITLAIIASLAFSNYNKVVEQSYCRNVQFKLILIHQAAQINIMKHTNGSATSNLIDINTVFNLSLPPDPNFNYSSAAMWVGNVVNPDPILTAIRTGGPTYSCQADFGIPLSATNPRCVGIPAAATYCSSLLQ